MNRKINFHFYRTRFDVPILIFLFTAGIGVWAAYNPGAAWMRFWSICGAAILFYALAWLPGKKRWMLAAAAGLVGTGSAVFFLLANDWQLYPAKLAVLTQAGLWWMKVRPGFLSVYAHPEFSIDTGGIVAMTTPFLLASALRAWKEKNAGLALWVAGWAFFSGMAFLLSISRGLFTALGAGLAAWGILALSARYWPRLDGKRRRFVWGGLGVAAILLTASLLATGAGEASLLRRILGFYIDSDRYPVAVATLRLIGDVPFTGGGLGSFDGFFSSYILVIPFTYLSNSHNLFLDIGLAQGLAGLAAFAWIFFGSFRLVFPSPAKPDLLLRQATFASLVVLLFHGLVYDAMYGKTGALLLFFLPGIACALSRTGVENPAGPSPSVHRRGRILAALAAVLLAAAGLLLAWPRLAAAWYANLGVVQMAKVELKNFPTGSWDTGDIPQHLGPAEEAFYRALELDPDQRTANYHLGRFAMMRENFTEAVTYLNRARQAAPNHPGIVKTLAYNYVWTGQFDQALALIKDKTAARQEMDSYVWWWQARGRSELSENALQMLKLIDE